MPRQRKSSTTPAMGGITDLPEAPDDQESNLDNQATPISQGAVSTAPPPGAPARQGRTNERTANQPRIAGNGQEHFQMSGIGPASPADPLTEFIETLSDGDFYTVKIDRDPDPFLKRAPNPGYNRPCLIRETLGYIPFIRETFFQDLQGINRNSGGQFTCTAFDSANNLVYIAHFAIGDPYVPASAIARRENGGNPNRHDLIIGALREQAEMRKLMIECGMLPTDANANTKPVDDPETALAKTLLGGSNMIGNVVGQITGSMTAAMTAAMASANPASASASDKILDAFITNEALQERFTGVAMRLIDRVLPPEEYEEEDPDPEDFSKKEPETVNNSQPATATATAPAMSNAQLADMVLIEFLANACAENEPVTIEHEIFAAYKAEQPDRFQKLLFGLRNLPASGLIEMVCAQADKLKRGAVVRLILQRPEGETWVAALQLSAKAI